VIEIADLKKQYLSIQTEIDTAISGVLHTGRFVGSRVSSEFEQAFCEYAGAEYCVAVANGTDALELAIEALELQGKRIVIPALTAVPTIEAVIRTGNVPLFCDIDYSGTINTDHLDKIISKRDIGAVIPVHLYGAPAWVRAIVRSCNGEIPIIEDCAQAHGTKIGDRHVGTFGDVGCFSFYPGKTLGAYGDAGCVVTNDKYIAKRVKMLRDHGRLSKFNHKIVGRNSRMDAIQAAVLTVKLKHLDEWIAQRQRNAQYYDNHLTGKLTLPKWDTRRVEYTYHQYVTLAFKAMSYDRDKLIRHLADNGVKAGIHYPFTLPRLPCYAEYREGEYSVAEDFADYEVSLPVHEMLTESELERVVEAVEMYEKP
jgi:dTDP-4-amino-4,6-dideoxygalactose transaminase